MRTLTLWPTERTSLTSSTRSLLICEMCTYVCILNIYIYIYMYIYTHIHMYVSMSGNSLTSGICFFCLCFCVVVVFGCVKNNKTWFFT